MSRLLPFLLYFHFAIVLCNAQGFKNPIIEGFHPDPSVCKVGDDFYLVNSSFSYFPGVPIFHSKDLVNWEQIGHCLTRESQLNLQNAGISEGIYAPTLRYHKGVFYMVSTNVSHKGNFLVYTEDPKGEWSEPIWLEQKGIDPSLFFEGGKCYLTVNPDNQIYLSEIDPKTGEQLSEPIPIWSGTGGRYPEAPHIYKKDDWYFLLLSEGGTEYGHTVTIARSRNIEGPYEPNPKNPILTHIGVETQTSPIQGTGHGDFAKAEDGSWWVVFLGFRPQSGNHHMLGRETFLAPVSWNNDNWPVINKSGTVSLDMNVPTLALQPFEDSKEPANFTQKELGHKWNYIRNPIKENYSINAKEGSINLKVSPVSLNDNGSPTLIARRQEHINFNSIVKLNLLDASEKDEAGVTVFMDHQSHYDLFLRQKNNSKQQLVLRYILGELTQEKIITELSNEEVVYLNIEGSNDYYDFSYSLDGENYNFIDKMDVRYLSSETTGGFTGIMLGMFAVSDDNSSIGFGKFYEFDYLSPEE